MSYPELLQLDQSRTETGEALETPACRLVPQTLSGPLTRGKPVGRVRPPQTAQDGGSPPTQLTMIMPVRVAFGANWKSSRSLMFLTASVTCTTLFMKAILRQMSCAQTMTRGRKQQAVREPRRPQAPACAPGPCGRRGRSFPTPKKRRCQERSERWLAPFCLSATWRGRGPGAGQGIALQCPPEGAASPKPSTLCPRTARPVRGHLH